jgi:hypothetical protein
MSCHFRSLSLTMTSPLIVKLRLEPAMVLHGETLIRRDHCVSASCYLLA